MHRGAFHDYWADSNCIVLLVVHCKDCDQAVQQARIAVASGAHGILLINQVENDDGSVTTLPVNPDFTRIISAVRRAIGDKPFLGVNCLAMTADVALPLVTNDDCRIDAYWADDARIDEGRGVADQVEAERISSVRSAHSSIKFYFGGVAFKKQRVVAEEDWSKAVALATPFMDVVVTSGTATGVPADINKIIQFRQAADTNALAVGSGVTPENIDKYLPYVDCIIVATGVSKSFHGFDVGKLDKLLCKCRGYPWYAGMMQPRVREPSSDFAWLDPSAIYGDKYAWSALLEDLRAKISHVAGEDSVAALAGVDATGFITGGALSALIGVPFIIIRKANKLCVHTIGVDYVDYSGKTKRLEIRSQSHVSVSAASTGVIVVD
ncbi:conserved hypothetical protein [Perkinsus marinus ATCC 50983]|uniref:Uncharacterized protein n=1 Tax=Perkinsus marinus (strain ATCC 50983 / TXsc) TaxID=423536 RepID=C5KQ75_PERM5|nr:conserved hypothetical protein [Perkinsus marinus ATCC 50983]EER13359.1 conserved hypothetical protein [Perkinsus marinus ATCC 50983]|eukprot:XP_002781564.1 conserved hypothetical protein [Perkinsus marinus ATCC 50983]